MAEDKNTGTLEEAKAAAKKSAATKFRQNARKQNVVTVNNTYTLVPFSYGKDGKVVDVPIVRRIAKLYGMPEHVPGRYKTTTSGKVIGKGIGNFKGKTIKVSRGYILKDRKTATKGKITGSGGKRSISLTKSYTRVWTSLRVPLDANTVEIIDWIKRTWKSTKKPDILKVGSQTISIGLNKTKAQHKAETVSAKEAKG